jgi:crotonobetainyl-CoA:carnitine CoA-transferase CaiB-like acyl-CoA transferase
MPNFMFQKIKIVELASVLAGPAVGMFFAELGAQVLKIENKKTGGDMTRGWRLPTENPENPVSAYWSCVNFNKEIVQIDLENAENQRFVLEKIAEADIVISNFKPKSARRLGMDSETLRAKNPRLIFAQIDAFADPEDPRPAFDIVLQAEAGIISMTGIEGGAPVRMPIAFIDLLAAHQLKEAILVALWQRERTKKGATVRTSLYESAVASLANQATNWLMGGQIPVKMGMAHPNIAPYGDVFLTKDGKEMVLAVGTERQFSELCETSDLLKNLPQLPDYQSNKDRVKNRSSLNLILAAAILEKNRDAFLAELTAKNVPAARILNIAEVFEQPEAERMILEEVVEGQLTRRVKTVAFSILD